MPEATGVLKLIVELAEAELNKVTKLSSGVRDLDAAVGDLEKQDLKLDTQGLDKAQKELKETTRDVKDLAKEGDRLEKEFTRASRALEKASKRIDFDPASRSTQRLRAEVDRAGRAMLEFGRKAPRALNATEKELKDVERATRKARNEFKKFSQDAAPSKFSKLIGTFQSLRSAVAGFLAAIVVRKVAELGGAAVKAANDLQRLENALDSIEDVGADEVLERVRARAEALGADLEGLEASTAKFINTALRMGLTLKESEAIIEGFSVAATGAGRSQEELNRALRQVEQGLAKNKFEMQDLKIIMEVLPGVTEALARGLGITTERLFDLQKKGLIPAKEATLVLAAELPKLFGPAILKNAADFRSTLQRVQNGIFETSREIGESMIPELQEWIKLFEELEISSTSVAESISRDFKNISDRLQTLVRGVTQFVKRDWAGLWDLAAGIFERFTLAQFKDSKALVENVKKITGISLVSLEFMDKEIEKLENRISDRQKKNLEGQLAAEKEAAAKRRVLLEKEQAEREELAKKAKESFLANLKDRNEKALTELGDFAAERRALLEESEAGAGAEIGVTGTGISETKSQLESIQRVLGEIQSSAADGLLLADPARADIDALFDVQSALQGVASSSGQAADGLAVVEDVTDKVTAKLDSLAESITKGKSEFDGLGETARNNIGLIITEMERLRERGGVQAFELADLLGQLDEAFGKSGDSGQTAAEKILDYNNELNKTAAAADTVGDALDGTAEKIEQLETEEGRKKFSNLGTGAEEAAEGVAVLDGEIDNSTDLIFTWTGAAEDAASGADALGEATEKASDTIRQVETEDGRIKFENYGKAAEEAADGVGDLGDKTEDVSEVVGEIADKTPEAAEGVRELGTAAVEAAPGIAEAGEAAESLSEPIDELVTDLVTLKENLPVFKTILEEIFGLLTKAVEDGNFATLNTDIERLIKATESEGPNKLKESLEGILAVAEEEDKIKTLVDAIVKIGEEKTSSGLEKSAKAIKSIAAELTETAKVAKDLAGDDGELQDLLKRLEDLGKEIVDKTVPALQQLIGSEGLGGVEEVLKRVNTAIDDQKKKITELVDAWEQGIEKIKSRLGELSAEIDLVSQKLDDLKRKADEGIGN